jgi:hypothetical protein
MLRKEEACLSIVIIISTTVFASTIVVTLTGFGSVDIAQGQVDDNTTSSSSLTPEQKDAICNPNNPLSNLNPVNTTESKICGIPVTVRAPISNMTTGAEAPTTGEETPPSASSIVPSANTTTGEETPPSTDLAPSAVPTPEEG